MMGNLHVRCGAGEKAETKSKPNLSLSKIEHTTKSFEKMVEALISKNLKIKILKSGITSIDLGENTRTTVLAPNGDFHGDNINNYSPIIKIQYGNNSFLFTGDAEEDSEKEVLKSNYDIKSDVLKIGHHGSKTSTTPEFFNSVNPSIAIISLAKDNKYNHPHKDIINLLRNSNTTILRTDVDGNILLSSDGSTIIRK